MRVSVNCLESQMKMGRFWVQTRSGMVVVRFV